MANRDDENQKNKGQKKGQSKSQTNNPQRGRNDDDEDMTE